MTEEPQHIRPQRLDNGIQFAPLVVDKRPLCVWEWDLQERNLRFLEELQPEFFEYVASKFGPDLDGEHRQLAATAIRMAYGQALETFIALACAFVQAPDCIVGWMQLYSQKELVAVAQAISRGETVRSRFRWSRLSWSALADECLGHVALEDKSTEERIKVGFRKLWPSLARDFLDEQRQDEYNGLKHGLRVRPGGFHMSVGREETYGVPAPADQMKSLGGSEFGTSSFKRVKLGASGHHYRLHRTMLNWNPLPLAARLHLIGLSIRNLVGLARIVNGVDPRTVQFCWPTPLEAFEAADALPPGVISSSFDSVVEAEHIREFTTNEILKTYDSGESET